jgi:hypothetical protein
MKTIAIALGSLLAAAATAASADVYYRSYSYDPYYAPRGEIVIDSRSECWNPRQGHFERVRPGERQGDLDFSRCRLIGDRIYESRVYRQAREECWNPRQGHFEQVRPGERQDDLDYGRCRVITEERLAYDPYRLR